MSFFAKYYDQMTAESEEACLKGWRETLLEPVQGIVLEVGVGTGKNLPFYTTAVSKLILLEPNAGMRKQLHNKLENYPHLAPEIISSPLEQLAIPDQAVDFVVSTLVLCSVSNLQAALKQIYRVLKPGGKFLYIEHVAAENKPQRLKWQNRLNPLWKRLAGNCHLNRYTQQAIEEVGFQSAGITRESMRKALPILRPTVRGTAVRPLAKNK